MEKFCQNPLCENPGANEVPVSVERPADQVRTLCCPCHESYIWGVQYGRITAESKRLWILAIADSGIVAHVQVYASQTAAQKGLARYLRKYHRYKGRDTADAVDNWLEDHEHLSVEISEQLLRECSGPGCSSMESRPQEYLISFLEEGGFVVLGRNRQDPHPKSEIEAWAYQGPLDFKSAKPVTFGLGEDYRDALQALDCQLADIHNKSQS